MAAFTHTRQITYVDSGAQVVSTTQSQTGSEDEQLQQSIAASATNQSFNFNVILANMKSCLIYADGALTIKTNSAGSPQDTITLVAGQAIAWQTGDAGSAPFAGNVSTLFMTNPSTTAAVNVKVAALQNQ